MADTVCMTITLSPTCNCYTVQSRIKVRTLAIKSSPLGGDFVRTRKNFVPTGTRLQVVALALPTAQFGPDCVSNRHSFRRREILAHLVFGAFANYNGRHVDYTGINLDKAKYVVTGA